MKLFINIDKSNLPDWQKFCIGRLHDELGDVHIISMSKLVHRAHGYLKKLQIKIEDKLTPVSHTDFEGLIESKLQKNDDPQIGDIVLDLTGNLSNESFESGVRIWSPYYNGVHLSRFYSIGEWEIIHKSSTFDISLCENSNVLDTASYNIHYSAVRCWKIAVYSLHWLVIKCIKNDSVKSVMEDRLKKNLSFVELIYQYSFYKRIIYKKVSSLSNKIFGYYNERWTIGLSKGSFISDGIGQMKILSEPKNEFWADPFLYYHRETDKIVLFIERFPFKEKKGVISCAEVDPELNVRQMHDILVRDYHFSFPFIVEEDGEIYMMPESSASNQLEVYKCTSFPNKWELHSSALHGKRVADSVYYKDINGDSWLFTTYSDSSIDLHCTLLMIYKVDSIHLNQLIPHIKNPILINSTCARNGGNIYIENGRVYRVSQDNSHQMYGHGINVHEITKLSLYDYEETLVKHIEGKDLLQGVGTHQMCQINDMFVMDIRKH